MLAKEYRRHLANRGGVALAALLVGFALLLAVSNPGAGAGGPAPPAAAAAGGTGAGDPVGGVLRCYVDAIDRSPLTDALVKYLSEHRPPDLRARIVCRAQLPPGGPVRYPPGAGAIQLRSDRDPATGRPVLAFQVCHPPGGAGGMWAYEQWFWAEAVRGLAAQAAKAGAPPRGFTAPDFGDDLWAVRDAFRRLDEAARAAAGGRPPLPAVRVGRAELGGQPLHLRDAIATALVVFALYFTCVYLLPTLTCEEREKGVLLAQAVSPASPAEILAAKFLFYPAAGAALAAAVAGAYDPRVPLTPFFWAAVAAVAGGFLGIGMTVATLARTQRGAFLGSMCYLLAVAMFLLICQQSGIPGLPFLALEYHGPRVLHAAVSGNVRPEDGLHLLAAVVLAVAWGVGAARLFRARGWQ